MNHHLANSGYLAIFSDVHGNYEAYQAIMKDMNEFTKNSIKAYYFLGDMFTLGPHPIQLYDAYQALPEPKIFLHGNHEDYIFDPGHVFYKDKEGKARHEKSLSTYLHESYQWTSNQLGQDRIEKIKTQFTWEHALTIAEKNFYFCHATPQRNDAWLNDEWLLQTFEEKKANIVFAGHTHRQKKTITPLGIYYNVGSAGMPFDRDQRVSYALINLKNGEVIFRRVEYDLIATIKALEKIPLSMNKYVIANLKEAKIVPFC